MPVTRDQIEKALNEMIGYEEGFRFQDLAIILAKEKWPGLIASEPKKDLGADALVSAWVTPNGKAMALACSITATLDKVKADAKKIIANFSKVSLLVFATPRPVSTEKMVEVRARSLRIHRNPARKHAPEPERRSPEHPLSWVLS